MKLFAGVRQTARLSGRLERIRCLAVRDRELQPTFVPPMLLTTGAVPDGEDWALELKWDGCRAQLRYDGRAVTLRTRNGRECSTDFPELGAIAEALGKHRVTIDGELVCLRPDGRPDFSWLRRRLTGSAAHRHPAMLQLFDLLHLDGRSTRALPYRERRRFAGGVGARWPRVANAGERPSGARPRFRRACPEARTRGGRCQAP